MLDFPGQSVVMLTRRCFARQIFLSSLGRFGGFNYGRAATAVLTLVLVLGFQSSLANAKYASIVVDADSGQVLHEVNADTRNYPASLTKMMTLYLAFEALDEGRLSLNQKLRVSRRATRMPPSKLGLRAGQKIKVKDAVLALVTKSANDVAVVVAEGLAKSEKSFVKRMNRKAAELGMTRTSFRNASGLPNRRQLSTARDMSRLSSALLRDFPHYYKYFNTKSFKYRGHTYRNHNRLLKRYTGADGIKTGYIRASGFNVAVSAVRDGRRLIAVVFGGKTAKRRDSHAAGLLNKGFKKVVRFQIVKTPPMPRSRPEILVAKLEPATPSTAPAPATDNNVQVAGLASIVPARKPDEPGVAPGPRKPGQASYRIATDGSLHPETKASANADGGDWAVQVGAFFDYGPARKRAENISGQLPELFAGTTVRVTHFKNKRGRKVYRSRLIGLNEEGARSACDEMKRLNLDCLVVLLDTQVATGKETLSTN
jgi:D-alanyl-D-alanine carboxypeptidase